MTTFDKFYKSAEQLEITEDYHDMEDFVMDWFIMNSYQDELKEIVETAKALCKKFIAKVESGIATNVEIYAEMFSDSALLLELIDKGE